MKPRGLTRSHVADYSLRVKPRRLIDVNVVLSQALAFWHNGIHRHWRSFFSTKGQIVIFALFCYEELSGWHIAHFKKVDLS